MAARWVCAQELRPQMGGLPPTPLCPPCGWAAGWLKLELSRGTFQAVPLLAQQRGGGSQRIQGTGI